ncbi:MAG: hypothetical protein CVU41_00835 [Chloroflexi bacterium HGW-Chloroflexi-3]|nr:MAG: hypothetical protein CVU41_00835 [Chloroflexi bacterium HGW-Chloroflexi-3]
MGETNLTQPDNTASPYSPQTNSMSSLFLKPCAVINMTDMETLFQESPLFINEENGGCVIRNQWDTRSIWYSVFSGEQSLPAMQWHTRHLIAGWIEDDYQLIVDEIISNKANQSLIDLQEARLVVYEQLEYRWERFFTVGNSAYWILNSRAFKGILDVVEEDIYLQIGFSGFLAAQVQTEIENLAKSIIVQLPEKFFVEFDFPEEVGELNLVENLLEVPQILEVTKTSQEIFFGDLCGNEMTTIRAQIDNFEMIDNVYLVYRLVSANETNDNWKTVFMNQLTPSTWEISLSAETSFLSYQLVNGAQVEYSIAIIYNVNNVQRSSSYSDILLLQCRQ